MGTGVTFIQSKLKQNNYSYLSNKFRNSSAIIQWKSRGQSWQVWDGTYKLGHTSKWNSDPNESQRSLGRCWRFYRLDFMGCDSPRLKIFTDSHLDRPECLWELSVCGQSSPLEIHFASFCAAEEWSLPMANLPDYTIPSWSHHLPPLKPLSGNTCGKQYWLYFKQAKSCQLQKKRQSSKCHTFTVKCLKSSVPTKSKRVSRS